MTVFFILMWLLQRLVSVRLHIFFFYRDLYIILQKKKGGGVVKNKPCFDDYLFYLFISKWITLSVWRTQGRIQDVPKI